MLNNRKTQKYEIFSFVIKPLSRVYKILYIVMFILVLVNPVIDLLSNATLSKILDSANLGKYDDFILFIIIQAIIYFVMHIFSYLIETSKAKLSIKSNYNIKEKLFDKLLNGDLVELNKTNRGEVINTLQQNLNAVTSGIISLYPSFVASIITTISSLIFLLLINYKLTLLCIMWIPVFYIITKISIPFLTNTRKKINHENESMTNIITEYFDQKEYIKASNLSRFIKKRFTFINLNLLKVQNKNNRIISTMNLVNKIVGTLIYGTGFILGGYYIIKGELTVGLLVAFINILNNLTWPFTSMLGDLRNLQILKVHYEKILKIKNINDEDCNENIDIQDINKKHEICFSNVFFGYSDTDVISNISFDIEKGDKVGIVGINGSGKSTLFKLILGLYRPSSGNIYIRNKNQILYTKEDLRSLFAYINQDYGVFDLTILENIKLDKEVEYESIINVANNLNINENLDKICGQNGKFLSGGQIQKICLSRLLLTESLNEKIILIDEGTSALDSTTEKYIMQRLKELDNTQLLITHKQSLLEYADKIILLNNNRLEFFGKYDDFIKLDYYKKIESM